MIKCKSWPRLTAQKRHSQRDYAGERAFYHIKCKLIQNEYLDSTERELIALSIGYAEMNGAKTEYDDPLEFFGVQ